MRHEALPLTPAERKAELYRLYRLIVPETNEVARNALSNMLASGTLRQSSATRLLQSLWQDPTEYFSDIREAWRAQRAD